MTNNAYVLSKLIFNEEKRTILAVYVSCLYKVFLNLYVLVASMAEIG